MMDLPRRTTALTRLSGFAMATIVVLFTVGCMSPYGQGSPYGPGGTVSYGPGGVPVVLVPGGNNGGGTVVNY
ncbi:MAG: hypothetical protein U0903_20185, partial [Planctomycetales bacterium]